MIRYLSPEQVLFLHNRLIEETGGEHGVRDLHMLLSAIGRPWATFDSVDLYPDVFTKGAALMDSLNRNHPFLDGNKRTAIAAAGLFLHLNGYQLQVENEEMIRFSLQCAQSLMKFEDISGWLEKYSHRMLT